MNTHKIQPQIYVDSDIAPLKKVLIHTPGVEIECMTPNETDKYLFCGVVFVKDLLKEYKLFKEILSKVAQVYEIKQCLSDVFEDEQVRKSCLNRILKFYRRLELKNELLTFDSQTLARVLIEGLVYNKSRVSNSFASFVCDDPYILQPLPNLYFARDTSIVVGHKVISAHMAYSVRFVETILTHTIFEHHPDFKGEGFLIDAFSHTTDTSSITLEGGDIHIWKKDLYLVGVSARTNAAAVDAFIDALIKDRHHRKDHTPFHVIAVLLPNVPSMIHLDMIFTQINDQHALVYGPAVFGANRFRTVKISVDHLGVKHFEDADSLLTALKDVGYSVEPVFCGHKSMIIQQREQWVSGINSFALSPGKIISYENENTLRALELAGFKLIAGKEFVKNYDAYINQTNIVITINGSHLAQGGGGPRCMTCPILRQ